METDVSLVLKNRFNGSELIGLARRYSRLYIEIQQNKGLDISQME